PVAGRQGKTAHLPASLCANRLAPVRWTGFALFPTKTVDTLLQRNSLPLPLRLRRCCRNKINSARRVYGFRIPVQRAALHLSDILKYDCRLPLFAPLDNLESSSFELLLR